MRKSNKKGFTLVELVVVIAIIGILAAILVPTMMNYVKKARLKTANANAKLIFTTCNNQAADLVADGEDVNAINNWSGKVDNLPKGTLEDAIKQALRDNGGETGYATINFNPAVDDTATSTSNFAIWSASKDGLICGKYPNPVKKVKDAGKAKVGGAWK